MPVQGRAGGRLESPVPADISGFTELILHSLEEGVYGIDLDGRATFANPAATRMLGWSAEDIVGRFAHALIHHSRADGTPLPAAKCRIYAALDGTARRVDDEVLWSKDGTPIPVEYTSTPLRQDGRVVGAVVVFRDSRERLDQERSRREQADRMEYLARHDELTGLVTRTFFGDRLEHALARAERGAYPLALMFMDLDRFKLVNDTLGHEAGDQVLEHTAGCLLRSFRSADTVARLGGDEFMVLMEGVTREDALRAAERVVSSLGQPVRIGGQEMMISPSIGISLFPEHGADAPALRQAADAAMYRAKLDGGRAFRLFTPDMYAEARSRTELIDALQLAVARREFVLRYQPLVDMTSGKTESVEALLRWERPGHGLLEASHFIRQANETGLIVPIGQWVLSTACAQAREWRDAGAPDLKVAVNVGSRQLHPAGFADRVRRALSSSELEPDGLQIELTDSYFLDRSLGSLDTLVELRAIGVQVTLDDFGARHFPLRGLRSMPLDALKIDRTLVGSLGQDEGDTAIVRSLIALGHDLGMRVYAEGVETEDQRRLLRRAGCDAAGGYLISHPLSADDLARWLAEGAS